jgi:hypothetical protein
LLAWQIFNVRSGTALAPSHGTVRIHGDDVKGP